MTVVNPPASTTQTQQLSGIVPGTQTTEFKLSAIVVGLINILYATFLSLTSTGALHVPDVWTGVVTALVPVLTGGVVMSYTHNRTQLKIAATAAQTQQQLVNLQLAAPQAGVGA